MSSPVRSSRSPLHWAVSALLVGALVAGGVEWVRVTLDEGPGQRRTPLADLNAAQVAAAMQMPVIAAGIPVLTYHAVSDRAGDDFTVTPAQLSAHLAALKRAGFTSVRLSTLQAYNRGEQVRLPDRPILLTFDDGTESSWTVVDPLLRDYGFNAVGFLITGSLAPDGTRSYYLDREQAEALAANGRWEFGGHTHALHRALATGGSEAEPALDHRILAPRGTLESFDEWRTRVSADLERSQAAFEDLFGHRATAFAYPFSADGTHSNDAGIASVLPDLLRSAGYTAAFVGEQADLGAAVFPDSDPFHLHRLGIRSSTTVEDLLARIAQVNPAPMPENLTALPWEGSGASCDVEDTTLTITVASRDGRCSTPVNTTRWRDYRLSADVAGATRSTTTVVSLRELVNSHGTVVGGRLEIAIGESSAEIREVADGATSVLGRLDLAPSEGGVRHLDAAVHGTEAVVSIDGAAMTVGLSPATAAGGVAFRVASSTSQPVRILTPRLDGNVAYPVAPRPLTARWWSAPSGLER